MRKLPSKNGKVFIDNQSLVEKMGRHRGYTSAMMRRFWVTTTVSAAYLAVCLLAGCGNGVNPVTAPVVAAPVVKPSIWVGAWGAPVLNADAVDGGTGSDQSFRFLLNPTIGGTQERVRFSNYFGTTPVTIGSARIAVGQEGSPAIDTTHDAPLTFSGQSSVTLAPGQILLSDAASVPYSFGQHLAVSVYLKGNFGPVSRHSSLFVNNYRTASGAGDQTLDSAGTSYTGTQLNWLLVSGLEVYGPYQGTIVLFGSSTTDGYHSNYSSSQVYPVPNTPVAGQTDSRLSDWFAQRLNVAGYAIGVVNAGIPGDTVTVDSTNITNNVQNANDRVMRDVFSQPNLLGAVTYFGSIDIRSPDCKSAPAIEAALQRLIATSSTAKVPLVLGTIPPSAFCTNPAQANFGPTPTAADPYAGGSLPGPVNGGETQRIALNAWMRSVGANLPGVAGIADFDKALADPARPNFMLSPYNSGDNYHPNGNGYQAESAAIPIAAFVPATP